MNNKGQIFTADLVVGLTVLLFVLVVSTTSFGLIQNSLNEEEFYGEMQEKALTASETLITNSGQPNNWEMLSELNDINSLGLAKERNILDENKVDALIDWGAGKYPEIKEKIGLQKYEFYFKIEEMNGQEVKEFGSLPGTTEKTIVIERYVLFEGKERKFLLGVFK